MKRRILGISAQKLSIESNLNVRRVTLIENGDQAPTLNDIINLCETLNESIDNMLYREIVVRITWK